MKVITKLLALSPIKGVANEGEPFVPEDHDLGPDDVAELVRCGAAQELESRELSDDEPPPKRKTRAR